MVRRALSHNEHKISNGWYSKMVVSIYSIVILILYSKNVLGL